MSTITWSSKKVPISSLVGVTMVAVERDGTDEEIHFITSDGRKLVMAHKQDCCESVTIEDIDGELDWLVGSPLRQAEESSNGDDPPKSDDDDYGTHTWTFYKFATVKGYVTIRWYGTSNGYYSESVGLYDVTPKVAVT